VGGKRGGISRLRCLFARRFPSVAVRASVGTDEEPERWIYELRFTQDNQRRPVIKKESVFHLGTAILDRPDRDDEKDPDRLRQTAIEQLSFNERFRDLAGFFREVRYLHVVPQLVRAPERSVGRRDDPFGGDFLEQIARTPERTRKARLDWIRKALQVAVPQLKELELSRDPAKGAPHLRANYEHWRPRGAWQQEEQLSDGTLRLSGLLWAALEGDGPLLLEEPEMSLHSGVVRVLPRMFARMQARIGRQILISTHSPDMLRDPGVGLDETLLFEPGAEGTEIRAAGGFPEIRELLESGLPLDEAVVPHTRPPRVHQLVLFGEG
jgi:hypothetical protein